MRANFVRFVLIGAIGTAAHFCTLAAAVSLAGVGPVWASQAGAALGAAINYSLNRRFNYRDDRSHTATAPKFLAVLILGFGLNGVCMALFTQFLNWNYLLAQGATTLIVLFWNFLCNHFWTFRVHSG